LTCVTATGLAVLAQRQTSLLGIMVLAAGYMFGYSSLKPEPRKLNTLRVYCSRLSSAIVLLAALVIFSTSAVAQLKQQTGETTFNHETVAFANLQTNSTYSEARTPGGQYLVRAWRGTDNTVFLSVQGGPAFILGNTQTLYAPEIVWVTQNQFMVLHTGMDERMYFTFFAADTLLYSGWQALPGLLALGPVSAVHIDLGGVDWEYATYRGTNNRVYGAVYDAGSWKNLGQISNGSTLAGPSIGYNDITNEMYIVAEGLDHSLQATFQHFEPLSELWSAPWSSLGQQIITTPGIAPSGNGGDMMLSFVNSTHVPHYGLLDQDLFPLNAWTADITGWQTDHPVNLTLFDGVVYGLFAGTDGLAYWKAVTTE
jgi:hypothetical protein